MLSSRLVAPPDLSPEGMAWPAIYLIEYESGGAKVYEPPNWRHYPPRDNNLIGTMRPAEVIAKELRIAKLLADNSITVVFRAIGFDQRDKSPDAYLIRNGIATLWDFKQLDDTATNAKNSANNNARDAKRQAGRLVYFIPRDIDAIGGIEAVNQGLFNALFYDTARLLREITILWYSGKLETLTREELDEGVRFSGL